MIVEAGHDLELSGVVQHHAAHHVHLPQLHGTLPLPPTELVPALATTSQLDQGVALETPVDRRAGRDRIGSEAGQLVLDTSRSPARMLPPQLADRSLDLRVDLVGAGDGTVGSVGERGKTAALVPDDPGVDALPGDAEALGDLGDLPPVLDHRQHGLVPLLHDAELHQHGPPPERDGRCQASAGATVKDQAEPVSRISRNSVKHQVTPE